MNELLTVRGGIPRFAQRVRDGRPATIVAFGTSMTLFGEYLAPLPARLRAAFPQAQVRLVNRGLRGIFTFAAAFRVRDDVLPQAPDLVLIEFAHNDAEADALAAIPAALDAIVAVVRAEHPACEFAFVYLAPPGVAAGGRSPAMAAYEAVAERYGYPSIDLAGLRERLVASGRASWSGGPAPALTTDGIHHSEAARELVGEPFAAAFIDLLRAPDGAPAPTPPPGDASLTITARTPVAAQRLAGQWVTGMPPNHDVRTCEAYDDRVAEPVAPGAAFRVRFAGTRVFVWAMGSGVLETTLVGTSEVFRTAVASGGAWSFHQITPALAPGSYELEGVAAGLPLVLGDLFIVGALAAGTGAPGVVK